MPKETALVTIGITCYNSQDTILRSIESSVNQSWKNKEIIVVDDASTDESFTIAKNMYGSDPDFKFFRHSINLGVAASRNTIVYNASGKYISFLDDDDESVHNRVALQYERMADYQSRTGAQIVVCYGNRRIVAPNMDPDGSPVGLAIGRRPVEPKGMAVANQILGIDQDPGMVWGLMGCGTMMTSTESLKWLGGFDTRFRREEEKDLGIRFALAGAHFISVDKPIIFQHKTGGPEKSGKQPLQYALMLREKHSAYLKKMGKYGASRAIARSQFYGNKRQIWLSRLFRVWAFILAPSLLRSWYSRRRWKAVVE